jgi:hypothetical protein
MERSTKKEKAPEVTAEPERVKAAVPDEDDGRIWYRKVGGGSLRIFKNKIIKPGERFRARPDEIPQSFRDLCIPLEPVEVKKVVSKPVVISKPAYELKPRGNNNMWFDVVDTNSGKVLNDSALRKPVAEKLISDLLK